MSKLDLQQQLFQRNSLEDFLAPRVYDDETGLYLLDENVMGFGFLITPLVYADNSIASDLTTFLNGWIPDHTVISLSVYQSEDIQTFARNIKIKSLKHGRDDVGVGKTLNGIAHDRADFLSTKSDIPLEKVFNTYAKKTHAYITCSFPMSSKELTDEMYEKILAFKRKLETTLKQLGMGPREFYPDDVIHITSTILNTSNNAEWRKGEKRKYDEQEFIKNQIVDSESRLKRESEDLFWIGSEEKKRYVKVLSCKRFPSQKSIGNAFMYFINPLDKSKGVFDKCIVNTSLYIPPKKKASKEVTRARAWSDNQRGVAKWRPILGKIADSMDTLFESISGDNRPVRISFSVSLFSNSKAGVESASERLKSYYASPGMDFKMDEESIISPGVFFSMLPFGSDPKPEIIEMMGRHVKMSALEAPHLMPVCSEWTGNGEPVLQMVSRGGELMGVDLWGSDTNFNGLLSAASGSGKSVFGQFLIMNYASLENALIYAIDIGNSYKKICERLDGNYFDFDNSGSYNFLPFSAIQDINEDLDLVTSIFEVMVSQKNPLSDFEFQVLKDSIRDAYKRKGKKALVDDVQDYLIALSQKTNDRVIYELSVRLKEFTSKGSYGHFFSGENTVDFSSSFFNVFELSKLDKQETLQAVVLFMVMSEIKKTVFADMDDPLKRGRKKVIVIDEGWSLIARGNNAIKEFYRTFRKANASILLITQNMTDIINEGGETARTMIDNSANKMFLGMDTGTLNALRNSGLLNLNSFEWDILDTVKTEKGHFSEVFFMTDRGRGVGRLVNSRYNMLLTTTDATESAMIENVRQSLGKGTTVEDAIRHIVAQEELQKAVS